jgi:hypothetical protein
MREENNSLQRRCDLYFGRNYFKNKIKRPPRFASGDGL